MKKFIPYFVLALLVALALAVFPLPRTATPRIPRDGFHSSVIANAGCRACHTPGRQAPLKGTHVKQEECLGCHRTRGAASR